MRPLSLVTLLAPALALFTALATPATAQDTATFSSVTEMRDTLDRSLSERRITDLLVAFGGSDEMSHQQMVALEQQVRALFPQNFTNTARMRRMDMENGFAQELVAYWTGTDYIFARVLWHSQPDGSVMVFNMTFNSDVDVLMGFF